jgi:tagatose 1,6-diphosphate aldolase
VNKSPSIGKLRGLSSTSSSAGVFTILALDHRQSFVKMLHPASTKPTDFREIVETKVQLVEQLGPHSSAVLLDPIYGAAQVIAQDALPGRVGLIVSVEETGYTGEDTARQSTLLPGWGVEKAKRMGADAVKLLVYYHPRAGELAHKQEDLVRQVIEACRQEDLTLFLEVISYSIDTHIKKSSSEFAAGLPRLLCEIARRLGGLGPDVLKLEFPINPNFQKDEVEWAKACEAVSDASPCPWALLSGGVDFDVFSREVRIACMAGASGFIAGRAVWQDCFHEPVSQREAWLRETGSKRLDHLTEQASLQARPWQDFYPGKEGMIGEDWYIKYGG